MTTRLLLALSCAVVFCCGQTPVPSAAAIFKEAKADAAQLATLLAVREAKFIADDELPGEPEQALSDYKALYNEVHSWPVATGTAVQKAQTDLRFIVEQWAIETYARRGKFKQALAWLQSYDPGNLNNEDPAWEYGYVIRIMLANRDYAQVQTAFSQCRGESDGFSFFGAAKAVGATELPELQRMELAREGIRAAATAAPNVEHAARFLDAVHNAFPEMDGGVEDAAIALLAGAHADAAQQRDHTAADERGSARLLALLDQLAPDRAAELKARYPADVAAPTNNGIIMLSSTGKVEGVAVGQDPPHKLSALAASDLDGALAGAVGLTNKNTRFAALAEIAKVSVKAHPQRAAQAADEAYALLDKDVAASESGYVGELGHAYAQLGQPDRAQELADMALDDVNQSAANIEGQWDLSSPEGVARVEEHLVIPSAIVAAEYHAVAAFLPAVALGHARACDCQVLQPLILAAIAESLSPAGAKARAY